MDNMLPTLQINLAEVRELARTVTGVAGLVATQGFRLRLPPGSPATDSVSLYLSRGIQRADLLLAYAADSAADELTRAVEGILGYAFQAANWARRTELAAMGLDVDDLAQPLPISSGRDGRSFDVPSPSRPALDNTDHRALSDAVLLSNGAHNIAHAPADIARIRTASVTLHDCARRLRAAMSSGERPAAMVARFGTWLDEGFASALEAREQTMTSWAEGYNRARNEVAQPARLYLRWLSASVAGGGQEQSGLHEAAARARAAMREYSTVSLGSVECGDHPRLVGGAT